INVRKAELEITWPTPGDITYGTALSETQLNATVATTPPLPDRYADLAKNLKYFEGSTEVTQGTGLDASDHTLTGKLAREIKTFNTVAEKTVTLKVKPAAHHIA